VSQRYLARPRNRAPANQPRIGNGVMRRAKRPQPNQPRVRTPATL
jgi:hypothetical protein